MRQASKRVPDSAEKTVRDIRRATRRLADRPGRSTILNMIPSGPCLRWQLTPAPPLRS
jgi:hypothetical protein